MGKRNPHHKAIQAKVAREGFAIEVRMVATGLTETEAFSLETERIAFWRNAGIDLANMTDGGEGVSGYTFNEEIKKKMSLAKTGYRPPRWVIEKAAESRRGKKRDRKIVEKIALKNKGKKRSEEIILKNSIAIKKFYENNPEAREYLSNINKGKKIPEENLNKLIAANKGRPLTQEHKEKIGMANKGKKSALGIKRSAETKEKMSKAAKIREKRKRLLRSSQGL
jgi:hypothetical protein